MGLGREPEIPSAVVSPVEVFRPAAPPGQGHFTWSLARSGNVAVGTGEAGSVWRPISYSRRYRGRLRADILRKISIPHPKPPNEAKRPGPAQPLPFKPEGRWTKASHNIGSLWHVLAGLNPEARFPRPPVLPLPCSTLRKGYRRSGDPQPATARPRLKYTAHNNGTPAVLQIPGT